MSRYLPLLLSVSILAVAPFHAVALAADGTAADETADRPEERSDIVVTGLRDDEGLNQTAGSGALGDKTLLDTPFSVTVVDAEDIAKRQPTTIGQVFINDPSVFSFAGAGMTNWWGTQIRGLGVRNYYIDDVPLLLYWGGDFPLEPVESVEALKGLTGFMYGFGAPGGTVVYRTKRPTADPLLTTEIGYRTNSVFFGHVDAGGPLTEDGRLGYRINLAGEKGTAYNEAGVNRVTGSLALQYAATPDVDWYATATFEDSKLKREPFHIYWDSYEDAILPKVTYDYENLQVDNSFYKSRTLALATGVGWRFAPGWSAKLTYGYTSKLHRSNKMFINLINQAGDYEGYGYNFTQVDKYHFAQAMVQGEFETGPLRHAVVAGASYIAGNSYPGADSHWDNDFNGNIYQRQPFLVTRPLDWTILDTPYKERQRGAFLSDTLYLGDHIQAIAGVRYSKYQSPNYYGDPQGGDRASAWTPTLALIYKPAAWASIYGSYVESLEPGTRVRDLQYANFGDLLNATISKQYEIGFKYEHAGLGLTAAAFRIERANTADRIEDGLRYLRQDGLAVYEGVELIASYRLGKDLRLGAGGVYLNPKLKSLSEDNPFTPAPGNIPAEAAKWQLLANADYYVSAVPGLTVHGTVRYFGKAPTSDFNVLFIPGRTIASAGVSYDTLIGDRKVTFTGNVNNLFNEKYWSLQNFGEGINGSLSVKVYW